MADQQDRDSKPRTQLIVPRFEAETRIAAQIERGRKLANQGLVDGADLSSWKQYVTELLRQLFNTEKLANEFTFIASVPVAGNARAGGRPLSSRPEQTTEQQLQKYLQRLIAIHERLDVFPEQVAQSPLPQGASHLVQLLRRFHLFARRLQDRHDGRAPFEIQDEYDVQDLLAALMTLHFDDIRAEEATPSHAGGSTRLDFLIKQERVVIEAKMTRRGLGDRALADQILQDIGRYRAHPDAQTLIFFVYDPIGVIRNPRGMESDLSGLAHSMDVVVVIVPQGM